jgi:hypothetical protein
MEELVIIVLIMIGVCIFLYLIHRFLCWCEGKGWIYYRKRSSAGGIGNAILEMQSLGEPSVKNVIEAKQERKQRNIESGEPKDEDEE